MSHDVVFLEACTRCGRVIRASSRYQARRRTPLICPGCQEDRENPVHRNDPQAARRRG